MKDNFMRLKIRLLACVFILAGIGMQCASRGGGSGGSGGGGVIV